ncbi:hypothetical protein DBIPINDM_008196 (plasmid) [Mesorhizobium sp. AR02]|uniref:hypothetical protein n=1 Tax=Mesorhizobium sp. AR02 TaxID=2865837 RepID=UPI00215F787E|nr:hypothetical protein [Mesorhizobium sp. AR02]UVK57586.1 hypothetical protein DBIPINDM_008196 [Mesorhizobium sp. AR02]
MAFGGSCARRLSIRGRQNVRGACTDLHGLRISLSRAAITVAMIASVVWRRQRDMLGMAASLLIGGLGAYILLL